MKQNIGSVAILVLDYDDAISFFVNILGFELLEDSELDDKRWVVVSPIGGDGTRVLLAKAEGPEQLACVGNQGGGRVCFFLNTDDFWRDYNIYRGRGLEFVRGEPRVEAYGTVVVFKDLYGNLWDLLGPPAE